MQFFYMRRINYQFFLSLFFLIVSIVAMGQNNKRDYKKDPTIDSIYYIIQKFNHPHYRKDLLIDSVYQVIMSNKYDTAKYHLFLLFGYYVLDNFRPNTSDYEALVSYANEIIVLCQKSNKKRGEAFALNLLAYANYKKGQLIDALKNWIASLKIAEVTNGQEWEIIDKKYWVAFQNTHLAEVHRALGNNPEALKYCQIALKIMEEIREYSPSLYIENGKAYEAIGDQAEALKYYRQALDTALKQDNKPDIGISYANIGGILKNEGKYIEALNYLFQGLKLIETDREISYTIPVNVSIGDTYLKMALQLRGSSKIRKIDSAIYHFTAATQLYDQLGTDVSIVDAFRGLALAYKELGNYNKAYQYSDLLFNLKDSLLTVNHYEASKLIQSYENDKTEAIRKTQEEKLRSEQKQKNNLYLTVATILIIVLFFSTLLFLQQQKKKKSIEKAEYNHRIIELELQSLRSQLNPHFMFNSLNSIQTLILKEDSDRSQSYLSRFARLLRMLLENADKPFIALQKEINFLELYLSLESLRVPSLQYSISTDPELDKEKTLIPNMFLQPYVENAIWHGLSYKETDKQLQIRIYRENGTVNYEIEDNGVGRKKAEDLKSFLRKQHQSKGMELLSKRVKLLNKEYSSTIQTDVRDVIKNNEVIGTLVSVKVPIKFFEPLQN
jgi:tetratricopeptide (TPR) repeat protein